MHTPIYFAKFHVPRRCYAFMDKSLGMVRYSTLAIIESSANMQDPPLSSCLTCLSRTSNNIKSCAVYLKKVILLQKAIHGRCFLLRSRTPPQDELCFISETNGNFLIHWFSLLGWTQIFFTIKVNCNVWDKLISSLQFLGH